MVAMRSDFDLPDEDVLVIKTICPRYDTIIEGNKNWVILRDYPVPSGYNVPKVDVGILIPAGYPRSPLDMAYFFPALSRLDGVQIPALTNNTSIEGKSYQRWSRHRRRETPWRLGVDALGNHFEEIGYWLENEFNKRPRKNEAA
jgi:hypothetical protein